MNKIYHSHGNMEQTDSDQRGEGRGVIVERRVGANRSIH